MNFRIQVRVIGGEYTWWETYQADLTSLKEVSAWGTNLIQQFNDTLRPYEKPRELLGVEILKAAASPSVSHDWEKINNFTISGRTGLYDVYRCTQCGVTGRRYGVGWPPTRDRKFRAAKYKGCRKGLRNEKLE